jgi:hypothetical protein
MFLQILNFSQMISILTRWTIWHSSIKNIIEVSKGAYWKDFPLDGLNGLIQTLIDALEKWEVVIFVASIILAYLVISKLVF